MKPRKKIGARKFLILFLFTVAGLAIISQLLYSSYVILFNKGVITDVQTSLLAGVTLATVIGITVFVGIRYIWRTRLLKQIRA